MKCDMEMDSEIDFEGGHDMLACADEEEGEATASVLSLSGYGDNDYLTKTGMCRVFKCANRTVQRMVERYEIPPPTPLAGRHVWIVGRLREWISVVAEHREAEAMKEARRMNAF